MKQAMLGIMALAAQGASAAQAPAPERIVAPNPDSEWREVEGADGMRAFIDRRSIRLEDGALRYVGRLVYERPDEHGVLELVHLGEINCARNDYRTIGFDALGASGQVVASHRLPAENAPQPVNPESPNGNLHAEFCR